MLISVEELTRGSGMATAAASLELANARHALSARDPDHKLPLQFYQAGVAAAKNVLEHPSSPAVGEPLLQRLRKFVAEHPEAH
jgi:hypothetical protein